MRILITGSTGWLGTALALALEEKGHTVVGTSRRSSAAGCTREMLKVDVSDAAGVTAALLAVEPFDVVVHLAGALGWCSMQEATLTNLEGTRAVMEAAIARGTTKFVIASSVAMTGTVAPDHPPFEVPIPSTHGNVKGPWPYAMSKAHVEDLCAVFSHLHPQLDVIALRIGNVVTPPPEVVHHDGKGIKYSVAPAASTLPFKEPSNPSSSSSAATRTIFPEGPLCSIALPDMIECLERATLAEARPGCRVLNAMGPTSYSTEPVADILRAWYGDAAARIKGLEYFETPGRERAPLYDLAETAVELGWTPAIDLNQGLTLVRTPVFAVTIVSVPFAKHDAWVAMATKLTVEARTAPGCDFMNVVKLDSDSAVVADSTAATRNDHCLPASTSIAYVIVERWASESQLAAHQASAHVANVSPRMATVSTTVAYDKGRDALLASALAALPRAGHPLATAVQLVIHKRVTPDQRAAWLAMAAELAAETRKEDGCILYDFVLIDGRHDSFVIVECWASDAHLEAHVATSHFKRLVPAMDAISETTQFNKGPSAVLLPRRPNDDAHATTTVFVGPDRRMLSCKSRVGKILVMYDSATSCTRKMAALVRDGVLQLDRTEVRLRKIGGAINHWDKTAQLQDDTQEVSFADVLWADGIAAGTPCNLGGISWRMKKFWDDFSQAGGWSTTDGKVACAFSSEGGLGGGAELACMALNIVMLNFGFSIFGVTDYVSFQDTLHYGATVAKAPRDAAARMQCRRLGLRLAEFVGLYIMHRPEVHPLLASKRRDMARYGGPGIPPRGADPVELEAFELAGAHMSAAAVQSPRPTALIFTKMAAYVHDSTPAAATRCAALAERRGYRAVVSSDPLLLEDPATTWDVIVLVNNSGDCFEVEKETLSAHVAAGRGVLGVHAALASFLNGEDAVGGTPLKSKTSLISDVFGAHFVNHPPPQTGSVHVDVAALQTAFGGALSESPASTLDAVVKHHDEFFNFDRALPDDVTILARVDEATYTGGTMGANHPLIWCHIKGSAPIFYCGIGHFDCLYEPDTIVSKFLETGFNFCAPDPLMSTIA